MIADQRVASLVLVLVLAVGLIAPLALHFAAALCTLGLALLVSERGGISETVQVIAYATAPCLLAGPPIPALRVVCAVYGAVLLVVGISEIHDTGLPRAALAAAVPAAFVFGYAFRGFAAAGTLLGLS